MTSVADLQLSAGEHVVYFYDAERNLAAAAAGYLGAALAGGGAAIAILTPMHRAAFTSELRRLGMDVASAERAGRLVFLDARATLDQLLVDGAPEPGRFHEVVAATIAALACAHRPVHAYGEMVGLLWDIGDVDAVIALERQWNDMMAEVPFSLLCAYPATALNGGFADSIMAICDTHSGVVSRLPAPVRPEASRTFAVALSSPGRARAFVAATLTTWGARDELHDDAALVVTELAANAIKHARSGFTVSLDRVEDGIRITVGDADPAPPARRSPDVRATSGRGLLLIDAVAASWGSTPADGGKLVWARIGRYAEERR